MQSGLESWAFGEHGGSPNYVPLTIQLSVRQPSRQTLSLHSVRSCSHSISQHMRAHGLFRPRMGAELGFCNQRFTSVPTTNFQNRSLGGMRGREGQPLSGLPFWERVERRESVSVQASGQSWSASVVHNSMPTTPMVGVRGHGKGKWLLPPSCIVGVEFYIFYISWLDQFTIHKLQSAYFPDGLKPLHHGML